jgi:acetyltransferase-like isoleucine patch superfamily enzyme
MTKQQSSSIVANIGRPTNCTRFLIYLEVVNSHRGPIVAALARTLLAAGNRVLIACETGFAFRFPNTTLIQPELDSKLLQRNQNGAIKRYFDGDLVEMVERVDVLGTSGDSVSLEANSKRTLAIKHLIDHFEPQQVIVWNGNFPYQVSTIQAFKDFGLVDKMFYLEVAWFSQREFIYLDPKGVNLHSNIVKRDNLPLGRLQRLKIRDWYERLRAARIGLDQPERRSGPLRIFVPLQVDTDTSIRAGSPFPDMRSFMQFLEDWLPDGVEVIFKAHPKARYEYVPSVKRKNFILISSGSVDEFIADADVVLGVNSTVLLEAAALGKTVVALGRGLFTGCQVLIEANTNDDPMELFSRPIDQDARERFFYHLVFERQISIEQLQLQNVAHLFSREPFSQFNVGPIWARRIFYINAMEGKSMIKVGRSKIARTASLDVEKGGQIMIGDDCEVRHHAVLEVSGRYNGTIEIGNHSVVGVGNWLQGSGRIQIGNDVIIGPYVAIVSTNHSYKDASIPVAQQPLTTGEVIIEDDVWIGAHCTISQNVRIGAHSIIGANSFVNTDIPPFSVAVGSPAKVIRKRG